jgi:hypothetical protein
MQPYNPIHRQGHALCPCRDCGKLRIIYVLTVARQKRDLSADDFEWAMTLISVYADLEKL